MDERKILVCNPVPYQYNIERVTNKLTHYTILLPQFNLRELSHLGPVFLPELLSL